MIVKFRTGLIALFDYEDGKVIRKIRSDSSYGFEKQWFTASTEVSKYATVSNGKVLIYDVGDEYPKQEIESIRGFFGNKINTWSIALSADGTMLAIGREDGSIEVHQL